MNLDPKIVRDQLREDQRWLRGQIGEARLSAKDAELRGMHTGGHERIIERYERLHSYLYQVEAKEELDGKRRLCVSCGKTAPTDQVNKGDILKECKGPDGEFGDYYPCMFDMTLLEAMDFWREKAHFHARVIRQLEGELAAKKPTPWWRFW